MDTRVNMNEETVDKLQNNEESNEMPYIPPLNINLPSSSHMPFVYFVVAENKMPVQVSLLEGTSRACNHAIQTRKRFLNDKKQREKRYHESKKVINEQNSYLGFCLGPVKDEDGKTSTSLTDVYPGYDGRTSAMKQNGGKSEYKKQTRFDGLEDFNDDFFDCAPCGLENVKKKNSIINLELPIKSDTNKAIRIPSAHHATDRESPSKRVQFSEQPHDSTQPRSSSMTSIRTPSRSSLRVRSSSNDNRCSNPDKQLQSNNANNMASVRCQQGNKLEIALPKIDILGHIYDEVIINAIDTFMMSRNISAKRRPDMQRRLISRLAMSRKYQLEVNAKIRQGSTTPLHSRASTYSDVTPSEAEVDGSCKPIPVKQKAFHMPSPGLQIAR